MRVIALSLLVGLLGVVATWLAIGRLAARATECNPHVYWVLGLVAALPAWLVVFLSLLGSTPAPRPEPVSSVAWISSTAAGLIGAILTEGAVRRARGAGTMSTPRTSWRLGLLGLAPAWGIALLGYALKAAVD